MDPTYISREQYAAMQITLGRVARSGGAGPALGAHRDMDIEWTDEDITLVRTSDGLELNGRDFAVAANLLMQLVYEADGGRVFSQVMRVVDERKAEEYGA